MDQMDTLSTPPPAVTANGNRWRAARLERRLNAVRDGGRGLFGPIALAWGIAAFLLIELVRAGGFWQVSANTRILDVLVRTGVVRLTDTQIGLIGTIRDVRYYVQSNDYIDYNVLVLAVVLLLAAIWLRSLLFHTLARFTGIRGSFGQHARAYIYGHLFSRIYPFGIGDVAGASVLEAQGATAERAAQVAYLSSFFAVVPVVGFAVYAIIALGYLQWLGIIAGPLVLLAAAYWMVRAVPGADVGPPTLRQRAVRAADTLRSLESERWVALGMVALSGLAFLCSALAVYLIAQAFTTNFVQIIISFPLAVLALAGAYLASAVKVTPGGLGQWEWGFTVVLWAAGVNMADAVSLALLCTFFRYLTGGVVWLVTQLTRGCESDTRRVLDRARGRVVEPLRPPVIPAVAAEPLPAPRRRMPTITLPQTPPFALLWPRLLGVIAVGFSLVALDRAARLLAQYWLLKSMGYASVFWTNFKAGLVVFLVLGALFGAAVAVPAYVHRLDRLARRRATQLGLLVGVVAGFWQIPNYMQYLLFFHAQHWGKADPVFHHDLSLYVFKLPAIIHTVDAVIEIALLGLVASLVCSWIASRGTALSSSVSRPARVTARLVSPYTLGMLALFGVAGALAEWLKRYGLLLKVNENHSIYQGAQYVDVTGIWSTVHAYWVESFALLAGTAMVSYRLWRLRGNVLTPNAVRNRRHLQLRWVLVAIIPGLVLDFGFKAMVGLRIQTQVTPNEPVVQLKYIKRHIDATNDGFDLNKIQTVVWKPHSGNDPTPSLSALLSHPAIANAPIWPGFVSWQERLLDPQHANRPFLTSPGTAGVGAPAGPAYAGNVNTMVYGPTMQVYHQQQKLRPYYDFLNSNMTRYWIHDPAHPSAPPQERIFASAVRELPQLTRDEWSSTWSLRNAIYTHGYGLVANDAQRKTNNGEPIYASLGIPDQHTYPELAVNQPDVYYGEGESRMAFVDMRGLQENDYATAEGRAQTTYPAGAPGGVKIDNPLKRVVLGYVSGQLLETIFSKMVTSNTRALYTRQPIERAKAVAPFLYDDTRPFAVTDGNHIQWMVNGMTTSNRFPYSQLQEIGDKSDRRTPFLRGSRWINYIRDSVKITEDAYTGQVHFYKWTNEPIVNTYASIYPKLFQPKSAMPANLQAQVQYPTQLAHIQMDDEWIYTHVRDPLTYFSQEDLFDDGDQVFGAMVTQGKSATFSIEPYYWMAKPGDSGLPPSSSPTQFAMSMIFTPENAQNLRAIGTVYQDGPDYGKMTYLVVPKGSFFEGPAQADAAIDQDPFVAQQLGFWNRTGVNLVRGQMMPLLANGELIYVEPLFIESKQNPLPRLKRVLVVYRGRAVMGQDLPTALRYAIHPNPVFPVRPGPELGGEPTFRIIPCKVTAASRKVGCTNGQIVDQFGNSFAHDARAANSHP